MITKVLQTDKFSATNLIELKKHHLFIVTPKKQIKFLHYKKNFCGNHFYLARVSLKGGQYKCTRD